MASNNAGGILRASDCKEGFMYKQGGNRRSWKKRYFNLRDNRIEYFKTKGAKKPRGTINLSEGKGVREKDQCKCDWPSSAYVDYCFGLATESRTYYFYTTSEEGSVGDWKTKIQGVIDKIGAPNPDWKKDHHGKPEETKSFVARKMASLGAKVTKHAMEHAPVDDRVKKSVQAGASIVEAQAEADPHAGIGQRAAMGVQGGANLIGATGVGGDIGKVATDVVGKGAEVATKVCKEENV